MESEHPLLRRIAKVGARLNADFHARFALCPLNGTEQDCCVYEALRAGRVPIVITDAFELPRMHEIDYARFLFHIGTCSSELELLRSIEQLSDSRVQSMIAAGRIALDTCFRGGASTLVPLLGDVDVPVRLADGRLLREWERFRFMWLELRGRVLVFGAGKYLQRLMDATAGLNEGPQIIGVADDAVLEEGELYGVPFAQGSAFCRDDFDAVLLATDSLEELFIGRVNEFYGPDVNVLKPSELMDTARMSAVRDDEDCSDVKERGRPAEFPEKLEGLVVCVGYGDFLSWSLPENMKHFDRLVVVTSPDDKQTQAVAMACGAELVISERFRENGAVFNKGKMLNDGFDRLDLDGWVLVLDADIVFREGMRRRLFSRLLNERSLYYVTRFNTPSEDREGWLGQWLEQPERFTELEFDDPGSNQMPWGYFQLFHGSAGRRYSEEFETAGEVDYEFQMRWPASHKVLLPEGVVHIAHGPFGSNWNGRVSQPLKSRVYTP